MIIGIIVIGVAIAAALYKKKSSNKISVNNSVFQFEVDRTIPDSPVSFGYKCMWFAIKTDKYYKLADILNLKNISNCNWAVGIEEAYEGSVFITPIIDGWTLACGLGLPSGDSIESINEVKQILESLSQEFGEAQFFCTHRVVEYHCWIKAINGKVTRVYSYLGEQGENICIEGEPTGFEKKINLINTFSEEAKDEKYFDQEGLVSADEELLMQIAENWSIDPTKLDERKDILPSLGLLGQR